ncbi:MAG: FkbM family methyltransferase [Chloroherpetonaceae bacterium]|nr:FkbM family methyltransferase [Chloroherpetonaceae bacterium]
MSPRALARSVLRAMMRPAVVRTPLRGLTTAGLVPSGLWKRLPVEATFPVSLPDGGTFQYVAVPSDDIGRALYWRGLSAWEPETVRVYYRLARRSALTFDVGANTGLFALIACAANPQGHVVAFEPVPQVFARLQAQIRANQMEHRCTLRQEAVAAQSGITQFHVPDGEIPKSGSLNTHGFRGIHGALIEVPVTTIDTVAGSMGPVELIKIDVEGFEDQALEGARTVLSRYHPDIVVECNPDGPYRAVDRILSEYGYRFYHLRASGPEPVSRICPDETQQYRNYLCSTRMDLTEVLA